MKVFCVALDVAINRANFRLFEMSDEMDCEAAQAREVFMWFSYFEKAYETHSRFVFKLFRKIRLRINGER